MPRLKSLALFTGPVTHRALLHLTAICGLLGAAAIHIAQVPDHLEEWAGAGIFFIVVGAAQLGLAIVLVSNTQRRLYVAAVAVSGGTVAVWVLSRTAGIPFGPQAGFPEQVGRPDLISTCLELATIATLIFLVMPAPFLGRPAGKALITACVGTVGAIGLFTVVGLQPMAGACKAHSADIESVTGPLTAIQGHSLLREGTPVVVAPPKHRLGLVVGLLQNCSGATATITGVQLLHTSGGGVTAGTFWVTSKGHARPGSWVRLPTLLRNGSRLPGAASVPPTTRSATKTLVLAVRTRAMKQRSRWAVDALTVSYDVGSRSFSAPFATRARLRVNREPWS